MLTKYSFQGYDKEKMARAMSKNLPISTKHAVEICNFIKKKSTKKAKAMLKEVIDKKLAVPFKIYKKDIPHRRGNIAAGRYPEKGAKHILKLVEQVEANANNLNLNEDSLIIEHISANKAAQAWHYGRKKRRRMKRTNVELVVREEETKREIKKESKKK